MNAIQKSVYEQYPTYMEFINAQEPEQMLLNYDNIHSIKEAISVIRLSVSEMNEIYCTPDFSSGVNYFARWLEFFNSFSNINKGMPLNIIQWAAIQLYSKYSHLYFADLKVLFEHLLEARFGKFYGSVDTVLIMSAFLHYDEERSRLLNEEKKRKEKECEIWRKNRIEELRQEIYLEIKGKYPEHELFQQITQISEQRVQDEANKLFQF